MTDAAARADTPAFSRPLAKWTRHVLPAAFGLATFATMALSWAPGTEDQTLATWWIKRYSLPTLAVELLIIIVAVFQRADGPARPFPADRRAILALVVLAVGTATFAAPEPVIAHVRTAFWIVHLLFAWAILRLCRAEVVRGRDFVNWMILGLIPVAAGLALFVPSIEDPAIFKWINGLPGFAHVRTIGYFGAPIAGLCMGRLALATRRSEQVFLLIVLTIAFTSFLWSGSRGPIVMCAAAYAASLVLLPAMRQARLGLQLAGASAASAALTFLLPTPSVKYGMGRLVENSSNPSSGRIELWTDALDAIVRQPLFGYGEGQARFILPAAEAYRVNGPHNAPLQMLLAWGVVGMLLVAIIAWPIGRQVLRETRLAAGERLPPFMAILVILLFSLIDGTLFQIHSTAVFFACLALLLAMPAPDKRLA